MQRLRTSRTITPDDQRNCQSHPGRSPTTVPARIRATTEANSCVLSAAERPWLRILSAWCLRDDLRSAVAKLTKDEAQSMISVIRQMQRPLTMILDTWSLPQPPAPGLWQGTILPLLEQRLSASKTRRKAPHDNVFARVKAAADIADLAGRYTSLRRSGNRLVGLCPFHRERTPSFTVFADDQRWWCFGACNRGGDVVELARVLKEKGLW